MTCPACGARLGDAPICYKCGDKIILVVDANSGGVINSLGL